MNAKKNTHISTTNITLIATDLSVSPYFSGCFHSVVAAV
jgi:hypothetical protein